jgi:hypothetical protein
MVDPTPSPVLADPESGIPGLVVQAQRPNDDAPDVAAERRLRHYTVSPLPVLKPDHTPSNRQDLLLALYGQICTSWRELVGVRFKLLALVPSVSLLVLVQLLSSTGVGAGLTLIVKTGIAVVGLIVVSGLLVYELRNSELHDDMISRGRRIEEELGVDTGQFRGRRIAAKWLIKHDRALALVYGAALLSWALAIVVIWLQP